MEREEGEGWRGRVEREEGEGWRGRVEREEGEEGHKSKHAST